MDDFENKLTELHDRVLSKALTEDEQNSYTESLFESIKHINEYGEEFWYARELQRALEYTEWRNFSRVIDRAVTACENSGNDVFHHFVEVNKTIDMPKSATKEITDYALSRYACYLIVQNGDSRTRQIIFLPMQFGRPGSVRIFSGAPISQRGAVPLRCVMTDRFRIFLPVLSDVPSAAG